MPTIVGSMRRLVLTPQLADVTFAKRGFPAAPSPDAQRLEAIPQAVICGFEWGIDARDQWEVGAAAGPRRCRAARVRLRGGDDGVHRPRRDEPDAVTAPRDLLLGPGPPSCLPRLHRHGLRDGQVAQAVVEEGASPT